jgi:DNA-binding IclR family transcriptional regulator
MVKSADRTLDVFELFSRERQPLLLTDIARSLDVPLSSCFNLVAALKERGYVYDVGHRRQVYPTRKMLGIATITAAHEPWAQELEAKLSALRSATRETTILGRRQGNEALYLVVYEGPQSIRYTAYAGDKKPLHSSSIGKALLSALEVEERNAIIAELVLEKRTKDTITSKKTLNAALAEVTTRGFAVTRGENVADVMAVAVPIYVGSDLYSIAIAGPMQRMELHMENHTQRLLALSAEFPKAA